MLMPKRVKYRKQQRGRRRSRFLSIGPIRCPKATSAIYSISCEKSLASITRRFACICADGVRSEPRDDLRKLDK